MKILKCKCGVELVGCDIVDNNEKLVNCIHYFATCYKYRCPKCFRIKIIKEYKDGTWKELKKMEELLVKEENRVDEE